LWWFRWGAMGTVIFGLLYLLIRWAQLDWSLSQPWAVAILTGGFMGLIMWGNVWFCIWPNQKVVIANAVATAGGAQANPAAAPAGRRAALASRTNVLFSIPMLFFMGAASHYPQIATNFRPSGLAAWLIIDGLIIVLIEINALVGSQGSTKKPLDSISGVIWSGFILWVILTGVMMIVL
jgi:uncharacterized membrane protein